MNSGYLIIFIIFFNIVALSLAEVKAHPQYEELHEKYVKWLLETKQEGKAGEIKEKEGNYESALNLYLCANLPTKASR